MLELIKQPWPWYVAGVLIGLTVPALLLIGNKSFGISSSLRHICAACIPANIKFFKQIYTSAKDYDIAKQKQDFISIGGKEEDFKFDSQKAEASRYAKEQLESKNLLQLIEGLETTQVVSPEDKVVTQVVNKPLGAFDNESTLEAMREAEALAVQEEAESKTAAADSAIVKLNENAAAKTFVESQARGESIARSVLESKNEREVSNTIDSENIASAISRNTLNDSIKESSSFVSQQLSSIQDSLRNRENLVSSADIGLFDNTSVKEAITSDINRIAEEMTTNNENFVASVSNATKDTSGFTNRELSSIQDSLRNRENLVSSADIGLFDNTSVKEAITSDIDSKSQHILASNELVKFGESTLDSKSNIDNNYIVDTVNEGIFGELLASEAFAASSDLKSKESEIINGEFNNDKTSLSMLNTGVFAEDNVSSALETRLFDIIKSPIDMTTNESSIIVTPEDRGAFSPESLNEVSTNIANQILPTIEA